MSPLDRPHQLKILLSNDEKNTLQWLADTAGLTVADYVRQLVRREGGSEGITAATTREIDAELVKAGVDPYRATIEEHWKAMKTVLRRQEASRDSMKKKRGER